LLVAPGRRDLHEHVVQCGAARRRGTQHVAGEVAGACARLDDDERIGVVERAPAPVERAGDARAEQRSHLGTRDEVATGAAGAAARREESDLGLVQRDLDEAIERDRALAPDQVRDRVGGGAV
jgi:hypothetical protein